MSSLRDLDPRFQPYVAELFRLLKTQDPRFVLTSTRRTYAQQVELYSKYLRAQAAGEHPYLTAKPGTSQHERGLAADIARAGVKPYDDELLHQAGKVWRAHGFTWGGDADPIHFGAPKGW